MSPYGGMEFHQKLRKLLAERRLSQSGVAEAMECSQTLVSKWLRRKATPDIDQGLALSRLLGVSLDALVDPAVDDADAETISEAERGLVHTARRLGVDETMARLAGVPQHGIAKTIAERDLAESLARRQEERSQEKKMSHDQRAKPADRPTRR